MKAAELERRLTELLGMIPTTGRKSFGFRRSSTHTHQGVDVGGPRGTKVFAPAGGTVTHASDKLADGFSGYGRHVVLRTTDGLFLLFAHLDGVNVSPGDVVMPGVTLGTIGDSCFDKSDPAKACKGTHLHFEVSEAAYPQPSEAPRVDPKSWLKAQLGQPRKKKQSNK